MQIWRNPQEGVLIEATVNSVRVSVKIDTHGDNLEVMLLDKFRKFLVGRAERFLILRRKPKKVRGVGVCFVAHALSLSLSLSSPRGRRS